MLLLDQGLPRTTPHHLRGLRTEAVHAADVNLSTADETMATHFPTNAPEIIVAAFGNLNGFALEHVTAAAGARTTTYQVTTAPNFARSGSLKKKKTAAKMNPTANATPKPIDFVIRAAAGEKKSS